MVQLLCCEGGVRAGERGVGGRRRIRCCLDGLEMVGGREGSHGKGRRPFLVFCDKIYIVWGNIQWCRLIISNNQQYKRTYAADPVLQSKSTSRFPHTMDTALVPNPEARTLIATGSGREGDPGVQEGAGRVLQPEDEGEQGHI